MSSLLPSIWRLVIDSRTGCADKIIRIFNTSGTLLKSIKDSRDVVRALCRLPPSHPSGAQFASAGNDGIIRLFTLQGQQVAELHGHESFIYSLDVLPSGELVSSGEDRTVRVWNGTQCVQTITHPAISVWGVAACQETGDVVTGASDRITRVFTRSEERVAAPEVVQQFEQTVKESAIPEQQIGKINKEQLPGSDFLKQKSGTKDGQVQMIREDNGSVTAHTWSAASQEWIAVGTVVDSAASSGKKTEYLGQDYDYVFDVDVEDGKPPLKLPFNVSQNPYDAATKFIQDNELPMSYLDQVAQFIVQNTQGATLGQASEPTPASADPWGTENRYRPGDTSGTQAPSIPESRPKVLPQRSYLSIKSANLKVIAKKLGEINEQLVSSGSKELSLSPSEVETVVSLCGELESTDKLKQSPAAGAGIPLLLKVATVWPVANRLPGLDLLRLLAAATPAIATIDYNGQDLFTSLQASGVFDAPLNANNAMLTIRMLANLFETDAGRQLAVSRFDQIIAAAKSALTNGGGANRNLTIAVATLYINFAVYLTSEGRESAPESSEKGLVLLAELTQMVSGEKDSEAAYRSLVALGTLVKVLGEEIKSAAKEVYDVGRVLETVLGSGIGKEPRVKGIIGEIKEALS